MRLRKGRLHETMPHCYSHATRLDHAKLCWIIQLSTKETNLLKVTSLLKVTVPVVVFPGRGYAGSDVIRVHALHAAILSGNGEELLCSRLY